jgi:dihydroneopterin aldolase
MDMLNITGLNIMTHIGVHDWEKRILQPLSFDIQIPIDTKNCDDKLAKTIDYDKLCKAVTQFVEGCAFELIETVADKIALFIKEKFNINQLTITVTKPYAIKNATKISVTVTR